MISKTLSIGIVTAITNGQFSHCISDKTTTNKLTAGYQAVDDFIKSGMVVGLGSGSTVYFATKRLGTKLQNGQLRDITVIPSSRIIETRCESFGIPTTDLRNNPIVDVMIDGVDEIDPNLNLVKGGSGSFLHEKLILAASNKVIIVCDDSKISNHIGTGTPIPVEIIPFSYETTLKRLQFIKGCRPIIRKGSIDSLTADGFDIAKTEDGNFIVDLYFDKPIDGLEKLSDTLYNIPGVIEHGLLLGSNPIILVASERGVKVIKDKPSEHTWKELLPRKRALKRESVDNAMP